MYCGCNWRCSNPCTCQWLCSSRTQPRCCLIICLRGEAGAACVSAGFGGASKSPGRCVPAGCSTGASSIMQMRAFSVASALWRLAPRMAASNTVDTLSPQMKITYVWLLAGGCVSPAAAGSGGGALLCALLGGSGGGDGFFCSDLRNNWAIEQ